jgi:hypothetical protein
MKGINRRQYFRSLLAGSLGLVDELRDELRGEPHFRLDEIASLPDAVLRKMVPVVYQEISLGIEEDWLLLRNGSDAPDAPFKRLMPLSTQQIYILNCFDGQHSIADICGILESVFDLSPEAAADGVKALFVSLAEKGICHPLGRPE